MDGQFSENLAASVNVLSFARLTDYAGLWMMEENAAASLWKIAQNLNMAHHFKAFQDDPSPIAPRSYLEKLPTAGGKTVGLVRVEGLLMKSRSSLGGSSTVQLRRDIRNAANDPDVSAILLNIDSPGGTVAGTDDLAADVKAARRNKPVWAQIEDLGASAAYWIASQAEKIFVNSNTALVGSIGTIQVIYDMSAAAEREGVKTLVFATGPLKGLGTPGSKVTDEQITHVQGLINSVQSQFDAAVKSGRRMNKEELLAVRHGGVVTAPQALDAKLIDGIQPVGKTLSELTREAASNSRAAAIASDLRSTTGVLPALRCGLPKL